MGVIHIRNKKSNQQVYRRRRKNAPKQNCRKKKPTNAMEQNKITLPLIMIAERRRSFVQPKCFIFVNSVKHKIPLIIWLLPLSTVKQASLWAFFNRVKKIPLAFRQRNIWHSRHLSKARAQRRRGNGSRVTSVFSASGDDFFEGGLPR